MQTLQAQVGSAPHAVGDQTGKSVELAPGVALAGFIMRFERNEEIFVEEEEADFVYKVVSGAVRDVRILSDGRRQIGAFHLVGDVFGLECGETHLYSAEAVVDSEIALVRRSVLDKAVELCRGRGLHKIIGEYIPSRKNKIVASFYEDQGFKPLLRSPDGRVTYEKSIDAG